MPRGNGARWFWAFEEAGEDSFEHGKPRLTITRDEAGEVTSVEVRALGENGQRDAGRDDLMADLITGERIGVDDWVPWPALNAYVALLGLVLLAVFSAPALAAAWRDEENGVPGLVLCLGGVGGCGIGTWQHAVPLDTWDYVWPVIATAGPMIWLAVLATPSKKPDQSPAAREDRTPEPDQRD